MIIRNKRKLTSLAVNCQIADNFLSRFKGLMGKKTITEGSALAISPCNSIHMFFMKFALDIVFIDKNNRVVYIVENIKPWRLSKIVRSATTAIELPINSVINSRTEIGDILEFLK